MDPDVKAKAVSGAVAVGAASGVVRPANRNRTILVLTNDSANIIYLSLTGNAVLNTGIRLNAAGGLYEINSTNLYRGEVRGIATGAASNLCFSEVD